LAVVVAEQVQEAVNGIADEFRLPGRSEAAGLGDGFIHADEEFAMNGSPAEAGCGRSQVQIVKGDDVSGAGVAKVSFIDARHFSRAHEIDSQFSLVELQQFSQQCTDDLAELTDIDWPRALAVGDGQSWFRVPGRNRTSVHGLS